ncbi:MAG: hypothetical protein SH819_08050 [Cytophagales bacterium]|nr:hypothetical protein [Cytophagales bacterium]
MVVKNPYAIYVHCDGAMDYDSDNSGGVGYVIKFPECVSLEPISGSEGTFIGGNIEMIEMQALITAFEKVIEVYEERGPALSRVTAIIFVTDRFGLMEDEKTSPYRIAEWRKNGWKNHEGKPIKNHKLLDELDKTRTKLSKIAHRRVSIEYRPRKQNKGPDKLAKAAKRGLPLDKLAKKGQKIGRRKFDGPEIKYAVMKEGMELHVHIFRKDPVQEQWEVWAEICSGNYHRHKLKIYVDNRLAAKLKRLNEFRLKIKSVHSHHVTIFRAIKRVEITQVTLPNDLQDHKPQALV